MSRAGYVKFIYSEKATKFCEISYLLLLQYTQSKVRWRFRKILWPSQNMWTFMTVWWYGIPDLSLYKKYVWKYVWLFTYRNSIVILLLSYYIVISYVYHFNFLILPFFPLETNYFSQKKHVAKRLSNWVTQANISESE